VAVPVNEPGVLFAWRGGELASPAAFVVAVAWLPPVRKLAPAPFAAGVRLKVTVTPSIGRPALSRTRARSGR
jgi:hypothetical protein